MTITCRSCRRRRRPWTAGWCRKCWKNHPHTATSTLLQVLEAAQLHRPSMRSWLVANGLDANATKRIEVHQGWARVWQCGREPYEMALTGRPPHDGDRAVAP